MYMESYNFWIWFFSPKYNIVKVAYVPYFIHFYLWIILYWNVTFYLLMYQLMDIWIIPILATMNNVDKNIYVQFFSLCLSSFILYIFISLGYVSKSRTARYMRSLRGFPGGWDEWIYSQCSTDLIPWLGRSPGGENGNPIQYSAWRIPWTEEPRGL